ncbi:MAG: ABC transporter permease [Rubripirellula sp.]
MRETKAQSFAIGLVIASGIAVFVMSINTLGFLRETRDAYYDRYRFADLFASVRRAPLPVSERLGEISGVATVQTRIVSDVTIDVPSLSEPAVGRLISLPADNRPILNDVYLRQGRMPEPDRSGEVLASDAFFQANSLSLGDQIDAVLNGRLQPLTVVGVVLSPEYVIQIRAGELLPDDKRYGIFWMPREQMEAAFDMDGAFNDVSVRLLRGAVAKDVVDQLDQVLKPYGAVGAIGRDQHVSARFLADEIKQLRATGMVAPCIFLGVAAFLLNVVLSRRIGTHRSIIATLKAFGYSNYEIGWHYLKSSLIVTLLGALLGVVAGIWMGSGLAEVYSEFYRFPSYVYRPDVRVIGVALMIALAAALVGSLRAVRSAVKLVPAEAMQPAIPTNFNRSLFELIGFTNWLPMSARMVMRGLQRRPFSSMLSSLGIAFSVAVMVLSGFGADAIDYLIEFQFSTIQRQDVQVVFNETTTPEARHDLRHLPGVQRVEPFRAVPVVLQHRHRQYRTSIMGLGPERDLYRLLDTKGKPIPLPDAGIVLNDKLASILRIDPGETLDVEFLEGDRQVCRIEVAGIASEYSGTNAYMERHRLNELLRETDAISGAFMSVDSERQSELYRELKRTPQIAAVAIKEATIEQFRDTIAANQMTMTSFTVFFAAVIAIGVVYNTARISLDERSRELATMRVIGFTRMEVSVILLGELAVLTLFAIPLGWLIGYGFSAAMVSGFESELYRIPLVIRPQSYARAAMVTATAATASGWLVRRRLNQLDLVDVLKSRE